jgi:hypothetical protein
MGFVSLILRRWVKRAFYLSILIAGLISGALSAPPLFAARQSAGVLTPALARRPIFLFASLLSVIRRHLF